MEELTTAFKDALEKRKCSLRALSRETGIPLTELHRMKTGYPSLTRILGRYSIALKALHGKALIVVGG